MVIIGSKFSYTLWTQFNEKHKNIKEKEKQISPNLKNSYLW